MTINKDVTKLVQRLRSKQLVVFDFDGVLADSVEVKTEAFARLYEPYGADVVAQVISHHRNHGGMSRFEKFKFYHREFIGESLDEHGLVALADAFSSLVKQAVVDAPEIPGAKAALQNLCNRGITCAVNSGTPQQEMIDIVKQRSWAEFFVKVYGAPASKKENLEKIIEDCAVTVGQTIFFGDARSDLEAAVSLKVDFIGVGDWIRTELDALDAKYFSIMDYQELNPLISN